MNRLSPERLTLWLTALVAFAIAFATLTPAAHMPEGPPGTDKLHHFVAFAALVFPAIAIRPGRILWLAPLAVGYGGVIELIQPQFGREVEWGDVLANTVGVAIGTLAGLAVHQAAFRQHRRRTRR